MVFGYQKPVIQRIDCIWMLQTKVPQDGFTDNDHFFCKSIILLPKSKLIFAY